MESRRRMRGKRYSVHCTSGVSVLGILATSSTPTGLHTVSVETVPAKLEVAFDTCVVSIDLRDMRCSASRESERELYPHFAIAATRRWIENGRHMNSE
jgi:hypothetical protein